MAGRRILLLGGTAEAVEIARRLQAMGGFSVITSLAGATSNPAPLPGEVRSGGFGGIDGLADYLDAARIDAIIDASHPFASRISRNVLSAAMRTERPLIRLARPAWQAVEGDCWHEVDSIPAAAAWLQASPLPDGAAVLLTIGSNRVAAFRGIGRLRLVVRVIETPPADRLPANAIVIRARGPFSEEAERDLMRHHDIAALVSRNSGGATGYSRIAAARALRIPVVLVRQPAELATSVVYGVGGAIDRVCQLV